MKKVFARTSNVVKFTSAMARLQGRQNGIPGMALVYGKPGLGKSQTALWWYAKNNGIYIRAKAAMTVRWMLADIASELGEAPEKTTEKLFKQAQSQLASTPRFIFVDEADYLIHDPRVIETLRDLHDMTDTPIILLGMDMADKKFARFKHLYDRFSEVLSFSELTHADVKAIADQMCEVKIAEDAISYLYAQGNRFRPLVKNLYKCESLAKANDYKEITAAHLTAVAAK